MTGSAESAGEWAGLCTAVIHRRSLPRIWFRSTRAKSGSMPLWGVPIKSSPMPRRTGSIRWETSPIAARVRGSDQIDAQTSRKD